MRGDVVVALATPPGRGALAVVRLSGAAVPAVVAQIARPVSPVPVRSGRARRVEFVDAAGVFDDGVLLLGGAPHTFTGEPTAELTCHGNPVVVRRLIAAALAAGARPAVPGEFTRRALAHGKLDLVAAEGVLQLAMAASDRGLDVARAAADGRLLGLFADWRGRVVALAAELEARLDHPDDELALIDDDEVVDRLASLADEARSLAGTWSAGHAAVHGARVALVGAVNAGKSSLLNALLGRPRALVHASPGTTRDVLEIADEVDGLAITWLDTAGERETDDPIEAAGQALAAELVAHADLLVVVVAASVAGPDAASAELLHRVGGRPHLVVYNGVDRPGVSPAPSGWLATSAVDGTGVAALRAAVVEALCGAQTTADALWIASARHRDLIADAVEALDEARRALPLAGPAVAADQLADALAALDALTGADGKEEVLDALFARFCIGK